MENINIKSIYYITLPRIATQILAPLTNALKGPDKFLLWTEDLNSAFVLAKNLLAAVPVLTHPEPGAPISLAVDASDSHVSAVLQRKLLVSVSFLFQEALLRRIQVLRL